MSNGYLLAAGDDVAAAHEISDGFGLDVIDAGSIDNPDTAGSALAAAANVGLLISSASANDEKFVALLRALAQHLQRAQLILVDADARAALPFLPEAWPAMALEEARARSAELVRQRNSIPAGEPKHATPLPPPATSPADEPAPQTGVDPGVEAPAALQEQTDANQTDGASDGDALAHEEHGCAKAAQDEKTEDGALSAPAPGGETGVAAPPVAAPPVAAPPVTAPPAEAAPPAPAHPPAPELSAPNEGPSLGGVSSASPPQGEGPREPTHQESAVLERQPEAARHSMPAPAPSAPAPQQAAPSMPKRSAPERERASAIEAARPGGSTAAAMAPTDATAFAPKKLRRDTPELVRIVIHQPKDLQAVLSRVRKEDRRAEPAASGAPMGEAPIGASIGVALEVKGAACDGAMQRRKWLGEPIDFPFTLEAEAGVKQAVITARVFLDDAQIGLMAFARPVAGPAKRAASDGERVRMRRPTRVFLSYSSKDRELVAAIATADAAAGIPHFWDRTSLKSGETWHPRLRREIDRADVFHLCWSKAAAASEWVEKEAEHALERNKRSKGKTPNITVQMLDGPPWAAHPRQLDAINFDDFVRAAIVGYARGDGSS